MKHLLSILLTAILCATASAQTIKPLSYNASNNVVVSPTNANAITFNSPVTFSNDTTGTLIRTLAVEFNMGGVGGSDLILYSAIGFDDLYSGDIEAKTRTNLGLPLAALTNTNNANFISALGVLATNGNAGGLTNFPTVATASNVTGVVALINGGNGATNAQTARTNLFGHGGISTNISVVGTNNTNTLVFTNGLLMEVQ